ncbi:MAG TPA: type VI secretion system baseplate subunit TssE [Burkholderiaceae bacterium]
MAEALSRDRLYPSLLDRLLDDEPGKLTEPRENRSATLARLRENVLRDLSWLFNATQSSLDFDGDPLMAGSVINYGMPPLAGRPASQYDLNELSRVLRDVILRFEPRILPHTLKVTAEGNKGDTHNVLGFRIEGQLWSQPVPLEIFMRTEIDLESGMTQVKEAKAP